MVRAAKWRIQLVVVALGAGVLAVEGEVGAQTAPTGCTPVADVAPRESSAYFDPAPGTELQRAVTRLRRNDPDATLTFSDCEVDSFSTLPKDSVPEYAQVALRGAGMNTAPQNQEVMAGPTREAKPLRDLDGADKDTKIPLPREVPPVSETSPDGSDFPRGDPEPGRPDVDRRPLPPVNPEPRREFTPPSAEVLRAEGAVVKPILGNFLVRHAAVFRMGGDAEAGLPGLQQTDYDVGRFFRKASFVQTVDGVPLLDSDTIVLFDANWNVTNISRTLLTPAKLALPDTATIGQPEAERIAREAVAGLVPPSAPPFSVAGAVLGIDHIRRVRAWEIRLTTPQELPTFYDFTVLVKADDGQVLNVSDNKMNYTDAKVRRFAYEDGDITQPVQTVSPGMYTRDDNTLRHDFFYMANDNRGEGTLGACNEQDGFTSQWNASAWGDDDSEEFIRHTHRADRDFSLWSPADASGSFGESNTYFWSRQYMQWQKQALNELGVLPANSADYPKLTIVVNACIDDIGYANGDLDVSIQHDEGEDNSYVRLADLCRSSNSTCSPGEYDDSSNFVTCDGTGCDANASVIQHEVNHWVLGTVLGVGSKLDCAKSTQLKFVHEGLLGSAAPHAFWNFWYGVGYNPPTEKLFTGNRVRGQVHANEASRLTVPNYLCVNNGSGQGPYEAGRVGGQPMWEFLHGKHVEGSSTTNTYRPKTDTDFLILAYQAADLMAASNYQDRYEYANRVMQILEASGWPADAKAEYCEIWDHHGLDNFINPSYCS